MRKASYYYTIYYLSFISTTSKQQFSPSQVFKTHGTGFPVFNWKDIPFKLMFLTQNNRKSPNYVWRQMSTQYVDIPTCFWRKVQSFWHKFYLIIVFFFLIICLITYLYVFSEMTIITGSAQKWKHKNQFALILLTSWLWSLSITIPAKSVWATNLLRDWFSLLRTDCADVLSKLFLTLPSYEDRLVPETF